MTRQRKIILEELRRMRSHPTADEVYETVRKRMPRISLGTVYRNLEILSRSGLARKLDLAGARRRFDGSLEDHYHVRCMGCGKVEDLPVGPMQDLEEAVRRKTEFEIVGHRLNFIGFCPTCRSSGEKVPASPPHPKPHETANRKQE
jgi:Fur family ferric uptake transcriptional regulator